MSVLRKPLPSPRKIDRIELRGVRGGDKALVMFSQGRDRQIVPKRVTTLRMPPANVNNGDNAKPNPTPFEFWFLMACYAVVITAVAVSVWALVKHGGH